METLQALAVQQGKAGGFLALSGNEPPHRAKTTLGQWQGHPRTPLLLSLGSLYQNAVQQALKGTPYQALAVGLNPSQQSKAQSLLKAPLVLGVNTEPTPNSPFVPLITPLFTPLAAPRGGEGTLSVQRFVWGNARWPALRQALNKALAQHQGAPCLLFLNTTKEEGQLRAFIEKALPQRPLHSLPPQPTLAQAQGFLSQLSAGSIGLLPFTLWPWCGAWLPANSPPLPAIGWGVPPQAALLWGGGDLSLQLLQAAVPPSRVWAHWLRHYQAVQGAHPYVASLGERDEASLQAYPPWQHLGWQVIETAKTVAQWLP